MQYTKWVCVTVLLQMLAACSSNQSSEFSHRKDFSSDYSSVSVPADGRLRDEHVRMYVSVKIKLEQLRYQKECPKQAAEIPGSSNSVRVNTNTVWEKAAIEHFEFKTQVYFWAKNTIDDTLINYTDSDSNPRSTISNIGNPTITHNLAVIEKFKDELRFAKQYKLTPRILTTSNSALMEKPSS